MDQIRAKSDAAKIKAMSSCPELGKDEDDEDVEEEHDVEVEDDVEDGTMKAEQAGGDEFAHPDILQEVDILDSEKLAAAEQLGDKYKNKEYYAFNKTAFYDMQVFMTDQRTTKPEASEAPDNETRGN